MAFRTVLVEKAVDIRLDLNNIVVNYDNDKFWINIDEISVLIVEDPRCNISLRLLSYLCEKGVTILFCNSSHMPVGTLESLAIHSRYTQKVNIQINWDKYAKEFLWTEIVKHKINNQIFTLKLLNKNDKILLMNDIFDTIELGDYQNREGTISRIYFKELFGNTFKRFNEDIINYCLNYIYQIIRSKISQEIVANGYITSLGLHHKSELNNFNLSDDFIEPYRAICDYYVYKILESTSEEYLSHKLKCDIVNILNEYICYNGKKYKLHVSIQFFVMDMLSFLETGDISKLSFPSL